MRTIAIEVPVLGGRRSGKPGRQGGTIEAWSFSECRYLAGGCSTFGEAVKKKVGQSCSIIGVQL